MRPAARRVVLLAAAAAALAAAPRAVLRAQAPEPPQISGSHVEQVTVDVVVLDRAGLPVRNLTRADFTVLEEGQPKEIASFDIVDRTPGSEAAPAPLPRVSTNVGADQQRGRTFIVLFDDLGLTSPNAQAAKRAVAAFIDRGCVEGDQVTLFTSSGSAWWTTRMKSGRDDLMAVLKRLEGRRVLETARERITDYEAVQIIYYRDVTVAQRVQDRLERYGTKTLQEVDKTNYAQARDFFQRGVVDPYVESMAMQTYLKAKVRLEASLGMIERAVRSLSDDRSRKALVLVSEGFVDDPTQAGPRRVVEAARRANAAIYFVDASGLRALDPMYSAEFGEALDTRDTMAAIADLSREGEGAEVLADRTGGFSIRDTNGLEQGTVRIGRESQSYYLLGYNPGEVPRDGRFRKIEVRVRGAKYTVRARRGYFAPASEGEAPYRPSNGADPVLQSALDSPRTADGIPLRLTAYVLEDEGPRGTHVVLAADADVSRVEFAAAAGPPQATLDTLAVIAARDSSEAQRVDMRVEIQRKSPPPGGGPVWYSFLRDLYVRPGEQEAKLVVRDTKSNRVGTVIHRFSVPAPGAFRVSTPVLTDTLAEAAAGGGPVMLARRTFSQAASLFCRFDVYGAAKGPDSFPRVAASHALRRGAETIGRAAPTLIQPTSLGALARMVQIPLRAYPPGDYELVLDVTDQVSGQTQQLVEPFTIIATPVASR
ncbi:MAG: VWA domain-containing protein [Vicinamibacteria bacterium]